MTLEIQQLVVKGMLFGQQIRNIFVGQWNDPLGLNPDEGFIENYIDAVYAPILSKFSSELAFSDIDVYVRTAGKWILKENLAHVIAGTSTSQVLPLACAAVVLGKVAAYRGFGRKFFAGFCEDSNDGGAWVSGTVSALLTAAMAYITPYIVGGVGWYPGLLDKNEVFRPFVGTVVDAIVGSMRRRKQGVGI